MQQRLLVGPLLLLQIVGFALFLKGFFPQKAVLGGFSSFEDDSSPFAYQDGSQFDKIIFVVVDALRADFLYDVDQSSMHFLHTLVRNGEAIPFTAFANPPTVTLPRLKGITTGGTPSFIDAVLNIADDKDQSQSLSHHDSWLRQFKYSGTKKILHFFGDDTWLKLFPSDDFFEVSEGTSSFFVSDFTEVDQNVTRHLHEEIEDVTWDGLFLHYLGLDHIGHKGGPKSVFMKPKQMEMDTVLERLYTSRVAESNSTLLVLMGDHGMNDLGNHGGSSAGETSPGLILASPKFSRLSNGSMCPIEKVDDFQYYSRVSQIDLVPTLATLLNFPIPKNNLGVIIPEILQLWSSRVAKNRILFENCKQFLSLMEKEYSMNDQNFRRLSQEFENLRNFDQEDQENYYKFLIEVQKSLTNSAANYHYPLIFTGFTAIATSATIAITFTIVSGLSMKGSDSTVQMLFLAFSFFYAFHFHGSSLIEEEHQLWWFLSIVTFSAFLPVVSFQESGNIVTSICCIRIIRAWANSGQKYFTDRTISTFLFQHSDLQWLAIILTYIIATYLIFTKGDYITCFELPGVKARRFKSDDFASLASFIFLSVISSLSLSFKLSQYRVDGHEIPNWLNFLWSFICESFGLESQTDKKILQDMNVQISKLFFFCLCLIILGRIIIAKIRNLKQTVCKDVINMITLLLLHQTRTENIPVFLVFMCLRRSLGNLIPYLESLSWESCVVLISATSLCLQNLSFFSIGNTNSLATLDISNAYNGVAQYDVIQVGALAFISSFAVAIYWSLCSLDLVLDLCKEKGVSSLKAVSSMLFQTTVFYSYSAVSLVASCINLRFHLFIWSVFSPKLLYFASWSILMNALVGGFITIILTCL